jgi:baseplate J-like protein
MGDFSPTDRSSDRRELLLASALNGIDALEVLDSDAPAATPRQRTLLVELLRPLPPGFSAANIRLEGGVRVKGIAVAWAFAGADFDPPSKVPAAVVPAPEQSALAAVLQSRYPAQADRARVLVVRTGSGTHDWEGDLSTYVLRLAAGASDEAVPPGFDLKFSRIDFRFKVECPRDGDCGAAPCCPPEPPGELRVDYLAKDYASFRRLMLDRLAVVMPAFADRNPADVVITLIEALAYRADQLSYFQDAVATEAYLGTARRRVSVRRHARLLDYQMHDGCNARAFVAFESGPPDGVILPAGTRICTRQAGSGAPIATPPLDEGTLVFETLHALTLRQNHGRIPVYAWGNSRYWLAKGATSTDLDVSGAPLALAAGDVLVFEEILGPDGRARSADVRRRQAVRLASVADPVHDALTGGDYVTVGWEPADALRFPLCVRDIVDEKPVVDMSVARGNVVLADAGWPVDDETLPKPDPDRPYRPALLQPGMTHSEPWVPVPPWPAAADTLNQDPRRALASLVVQGPDGWRVRRDLLSSHALDPHVVVEIEQDGTAFLRFGDGVHGKPAPEATPLVCSYRVGNGPAGNVGAEALAQVIPDGVADLTTVRRVRNPLPAAGGSDPESMEEVRQYAPQAFLVQQRAVTEVDYAAAAEEVPGVRRAVATRRWTGSWYTVFLSIDPAGGTVNWDGIAPRVREAVERVRLAGEDLELERPIDAPLDIVMEVCVAPGYFRADVKQALTAAFSSTVLADGRLGFFHPDNFTFGQAVYLSKVVAAAMAQPGVAWVDLSDPSRGHRFQRFGKPAAGEAAQGYIPMGRLEIARADSSPNFPENGRIDFILEGGS